jgi:fatty acid desaturase
MWQGYREMVPVLLRQLKYEDYFLRRELPPSARPYRETRIGGTPAAAE